MSSTRNKNTDLDYKLENKINKNIIEQHLYLHSSMGIPFSNFIPNLGYLPSHMSRDALSSNAIDIESSLYGIGSTNLVNKKTPIYPNLNKLEFKNFFERKENVIMPYPLIYNNNQRPFPI